MAFKFFPDKCRPVAAGSHIRPVLTGKFAHPERAVIGEAPCGRVRDFHPDNTRASRIKFGRTYRIILIDPNNNPSPHSGRGDNGTWRRAGPSDVCRSPVGSYPWLALKTEESRIIIMEGHYHIGFSRGNSQAV